MANLQSIVERVASTDTTVLISGESGTGKELVAKLLREKSLRKNKPFLTINCTTISDLLLESELFGYEKGSFTGADKQRKGKFEIVEGGTIFLDEIGDISPRMQAALLRVLQNGEITRVGGHMPIKVDVRIIAATNRNLAKSVQKGSFRLDLFYRLNIINIVLPPLRDRVDDIHDLTTFFIQKYNRLFGKSIDTDPQYILKKLQRYHWPGNVRELENVIHRAVLMCKKTSLSNKDISFDMASSLGEEALSTEKDENNFNDLPLKSIIAQLEKEVIEAKLKSDRGNVANAAKSLEISKAALYEKMKRYGISAKALR
jgi:Nif-specific regulatory protein